MPIRHATLDDATAVAALTSAAQPDGFSTAALVRHRWSATPAAARSLTWLAEEDGALVGWANARLDTWSKIPGDALAHVTVHPDHRRCGVGSALWEHAHAHLAAIGARRVLGEALDRTGAVEFATAREFEVTASTTVLALDPRTLPAPEAPPADVELLPFAALGDDREEAYRVDLVTSQDEPGDYDVSEMGFDGWLDATFGNPSFSQEASMLAAVEGRLVGVSLLYLDETTGRALNGGTGVLREHRGRGLAMLMKRQGLATLAGLGITRVLTQNDDENAAMLRVNDVLGYRPFSTRSRLVRRG
jgi:GNAT superfamily N-acetyltransferase